MLVDSVKHHGHCIGGREVLLDEAGNVQGFGSWIRPVSPTHAHGELGDNEIMLPGQQRPEILDIVQFETTGNQQHAYQPENWIVARGIAWQKVGALPLERVIELEEQPPSLWVPANRRFQTDRITSEELQAHPMNSSLILARP